MTYSKEDGIEALKKAAKELGHSPSANEYKNLDISPSYYWIHNNMGSWNNAKEKADLEKYKVASERVPTPKISQDGYLVLRPEIDGKNLRFALHRLIAVAEYGFDEVCGKDVHHKNGVRWDNRPSNLDVLTRSEHIELHRKEEREETENQLKIHDF